MSRPIRLRTWLLLLILVAVLPGVAWLGYSHERDQREALRRTQQDLQAVAGLAASSLEQAIEGVRQILGTIAAGPSVRRSDLAQLCQEYIGNVAAVSPAYTSIGVFTLEGDLRCVGPANTARFNASDREYFREALRTEDFTIGGYVQGRGSGRPALVFAVPVYDYDDRLKGVAYVGLDLVRVDQRLKDLRLPGVMRVYMVDAKGLLLASTQAPAEAIGRPVPDPDLRAAVLQGRQGAFETVADNGAHLMHVLVPVDEGQRARVYVAVSAHREEVLGPGMAQLRWGCCWPAPCWAWLLRSGWHTVRSPSPWPSSWAACRRLAAARSARRRRASAPAPRSSSRNCTPAWVACWSSCSCRRRRSRRAPRAS